MAETKKPRRNGPASAGTTTETQATESKAAAEFRRFKEARATGPAMKKSTGPTPSPSQPGPGTTGSVGAGSMGGASWGAIPMPGLPAWAPPPMFSLPQPPQGWMGMPPQPGMMQAPPQAVGPVTDRLGSTLRLGIDVVNMALAGSLRLLGGMSQGHYGHHWQGGGYGCRGAHYSCCDGCRYQGNCGCCDCCCVFEHDACCTPSVGTCC